MAIVAGARKSEGDGFMDAIAQLRRGCRPEFPLGGNTVVAVVATNAKLGKAGCKRVAQMAHDALGRCIYPAHTPADGDVVFALATGQHSLEGNPANLVVIGAMAADVLATAIVRGCQAAGR
jgi:L-aminopeptidase/D-esterase-like protein